jgi:hypothetical protein
MANKTTIGAEVTAPKAKRAISENMKNFEKIFGNDPRELTAKDGSGVKYLIENRMGFQSATAKDKIRGCFTRDELWKKFGYEKEHFEDVMYIEGKFKGSKEYIRKFESQSEKSLWKRLNTDIRNYKTFLTNRYQPQGIRPMFAFVPVVEKGICLYLQGFYSLESLKPVLGDVKDWALWTESMAVWSKPVADIYEETVLVAKQILKVPHVNKDIQHRMSMVVSGNATRSALLEYIKE